MKHHNFFKERNKTKRVLYHLKEPDYAKEAPQDMRTGIYARNPQHIIDVLQYYNEREKPDRTNPDLNWWLQKDFTLNDIEQVEKGRVRFIAGMLDFSGDLNRPLFEKIPITHEFTVYVPEENIAQLC